MTEKIGLIKNPMTIIAIFAGIAEVSGTLVLPFITPDNQEFFIYFLIGFPSLLVIIFFATLNFNNKVLYAPSDYKDESIYVKVNKYDVAQQKSVEITVPKKEEETEQLALLSSKMEALSQQVAMLNKAKVEIEEDVTEDLKFKFYDQELLVSNFSDVSKFIRIMANAEFNFKVYFSPESGNEVSTLPENKSVWFGSNVPLGIAKSILSISKTFYPHLRYIHLSNDKYPSSKIYIGGSTKSAEDMFKLKPLDDDDWGKLQQCSTIEELHSLIRKFQ